MNVIFDMETADPDDVFTLCWLLGREDIHLRAVTISPGTKDQVGLVKHVLSLLGRDDIPVGARKPDHDKQCVSQFHYRWLGKVGPKEPDGKGADVIASAISEHPDATLLTGAPLGNPKEALQAYPDLKIRRWVAQGGFAGDNIVHNPLPKFKGKLTCPTFNFNGDIEGAEMLLSSPNVGHRLLVSKNVCHGVSYDKAMHEKMGNFLTKNDNPAMRLIYEGMTVYFAKKSQGKMFHDPLAACVAVKTSVCDFEEVEMFRDRGGWGAKPKEGTNTHISVDLNRKKFLDVFFHKDKYYMKPFLYNGFVCMPSDLTSRRHLHLSKLDDFAAWAATRGWERVPTKGRYEVLRLRQDGQDDIVYFKRENAEYATMVGKGSVLVYEWLEETEKNQQSIDTSAKSE